MKSKQEEIQQFRDFQESLEKDGYLDMMFGKLSFYVEEGIRNDMTPDIADIIQGLMKSTMI